MLRNGRQCTTSTCTPHHRATSTHPRRAASTPSNLATRTSPRLKVLATHLIGEFGVELIDAQYQGPEYRGEVALHIALVNKDLEAVRRTPSHGRLQTLCSPTFGRRQP